MSTEKPVLQADAGRVRRMQIFAGAAVGVAVVGLFLGAQEPPRPPIQESLDGAVGQRAVNYKQLREGRRGSNSSMYEGAFARLRNQGPGLEDEVVQTDEEREAVLEARSKRRAYAGAPPTIPHSVQQKDPAACLACHSTGAEIAGKRAPAMSHREYSMCTQCHAMERTESEYVAKMNEYPDPAEHGFEGLAERGQGSRAYEGAPPVMPHPLFMRENCSSCHGVHGALGMRSTHPERQNCQQCHAESASFDQAAVPPFSP